MTILSMEPRKWTIEVQPLFIECNGAPILDQDEVLKDLKEPPVSDEDECGMQIDTESSLDTEEVAQEDGENNIKYACQCCDSVYPKKSYLVAHKHIAHGIQNKGPERLECNVSNKNFVNEKSLRTSVHTDLCKESFLCSHCGKGFNNKYCLQLHIRMHALMHTGE
ncbi:zinc finger protein 1 homolog [Hylaeus anthracinus]|uniref:zinc finger protein 1 homolog n=1 Tax=Hylaeus anthracinus TaxID=313031 RepID=UPI0023B906CF|nr:zinc finger protein 1 homolog [Hylaeus anthracinus]